MNIMCTKDQVYLFHLLANLFNNDFFLSHTSTNTKNNIRMLSLHILKIANLTKYFFFSIFSDGTCIKQYNLCILDIIGFTITHCFKNTRKNFCISLISLAAVCLYKIRTPFTDTNHIWRNFKNVI